MILFGQLAGLHRGKSFTSSGTSKTGSVVRPHQETANRSFVVRAAGGRGPRARGPARRGPLTSRPTSRRARNSAQSQFQLRSRLRIPPDLTPAKRMCIPAFF
jgi:hypothetical protein